MSKRAILLLLLFSCGLSACSLPAVEAQTPEILPTMIDTPFQPAMVTPLPELILVTPALVNTAIPTADPNLHIEQLRNGEYTFNGIDPNGAPKTYRLQNGSYQSSADTASVGFVSIRLIEPTAIGSLNNDEYQDAAVILVENYGGTGQFVQIGAVLNQAGSPYHAATYPLGDRVKVDTLNIQNNEILLSGLVHGPQDGLCCPSIPATIHLRLLNENQLMLTRFTTQTPDGQERSINIRAPLNGAEASGSITITGDVSIAPFENNLLYTLYDSQYQEITRSGLMVDAPDFGAPGTFALTIDLAALGRTGNLYVEITDLSAADGSVLALAQIQIQVR
ncbi:MAG: Gmad2 immunoglobulin-like domain-containing protein [Anaerolineales bacterium]|nr:Gmad2 immunoglobulin-like domain-containing protein [Anaerolineales bacterium]